MFKRLKVICKIIACKTFQMIVRGFMLNSAYCQPSLKRASPDNVQGDARLKCFTCYYFTYYFNLLNILPKVFNLCFNVQVIQVFVRDFVILSALFYHFQPYVAGQCKFVLKWKPHELNSVDFLLNIITEKREGYVCNFPLINSAVKKVSRFKVILFPSIISAVHQRNYASSILLFSIL